MTFLSPWTIAWAAGLTVPPLVLLYFLKLKRRTVAFPSTLLWKKAIEDLHVNAPFQRLRSNLLLLLQLLVLLLIAFALGQPLIQTQQSYEDTVIVMIDQSASMSVEEPDGRTRLQIAKDEAIKLIDGMKSTARIMVIAFCDRAQIISSFETDHTAVKRKIEQIEPTESTSNLSEAIALAEAYSQNLIIGGQNVGSDVPPERQAPPASTIILSDGRIEDADRLVIQRLSTEKMQIVTVGQRTDNVAIVAMSARRDHERPEILEVFATVRNFGPDPVTLDADLLLDGQHADTQSFQLAPGLVADSPTSGETETNENDQSENETTPASDAADSLAPGSMISVAFDEIPFEGGGTAEVVLKIQDALAADNRAVAVVPEARTVSVLLVTEGNLMLERVLSVLPIKLEKMTPEEYDSADEAKISNGARSKFDVVMFDNHSTDRLPPGNYLFWGSIPKIDGMQMDGRVDDDVIVHWEDNHPILRHVAVDTINVYEWQRITPPPETEILMEGERSPVAMLLSRDGRNYLIMAFSLIGRDDSGSALINTDWFAQVDFVVFNYNAVQYLASNLEVENRPSDRPGNPLQIHVPGDADEIRVRLPDGSFEEIPTRGLDTITYSKTRQVGLYESEPSDPGRGRFAVNLFSPTESRIEPAPKLALAGTELATAEAGSRLVNENYWPWLLSAALVVLLLEWVIYNKRVFV